MIIRTKVKEEDYIKHWGVKGMKWDRDKKSEDAGAASDEQDSRIEIGKDGSITLHGPSYASDGSKEGDQQAWARNRDAAKERVIATSMKIKTESISSKVIRIGKSFVDRLFNR